MSNYVSNDCCYDFSKLMLELLNRQLSRSLFCISRYQYHIPFRNLREAVLTFLSLMFEGRLSQDIGNDHGSRACDESYQKAT